MYEREALEELRELPADRQREVLDFAAFLRQRTEKPVRRSLLGALKHPDLHIDDEDLEEVREVMWRNFPRDFPA